MIKVKSRGPEKRIRTDIIQRSRRFIADVAVDIILLFTFLFVSMLLRGRKIVIYGTEYPTDLIFIVLFFVVFLPLTSIMFRDLKRMLDSVSALVIYRFPGMKKEMPPLQAIMRDMVQIIILLLLSVVVIPLCSNLEFLGGNLLNIISVMIIGLILLFVYDIVKNISILTKGNVNLILSALFRPMLKEEGKEKRE